MNKDEDYDHLIFHWIDKKILGIRLDDVSKNCMYIPDLTVLFSEDVLYINEMLYVTGNSLSEVVNIITKIIK